MAEDGINYSFAYDRRGNLTEERRGDAIVRQYVYDATGRMILGKNAESGEESAYAYNALRMCVGNVQKLAAADGQGTVRQYAERGIWGNLKTGTGAEPGLEENLRFTSYRYDPVVGKHFAHARLYDDAHGRMLALDPVRSDLNGYRYCGNDPVDHVDPDGEFWNVVAGAGIGGFFGGIGGFVSSAISQKLDSGKVNWRKAWGTAADGAITGAVQGGLVASGAGIPTALFSNFLAGTAGSAAEQYISGGRVSAREGGTSMISRRQVE